MKKILILLSAVTFGLNAYADGYQSYNMACELYQAGRYEEAKQRFMICVQYYPDDDLEWTIIRQRVNECDARIKAESDRQKAYAASIAKAREEEKKRYEKQQELRKERKLIYISVNASTLNGEYPNFKSDIVGALAPYGYKMTNNKEDAYWTIYVSSDVSKLSQPGADDPNHIIQINAHYTIQNEVEGYIPAGGEGICNAKGRSGIDYDKSVYDAYTNLKHQLGEACHNAIDNIVIPPHQELEEELENIIAVVVSGDGLPKEVELQPAVDIFMRALQRYSDYKVVDRTDKVIYDGRTSLLNHGEMWSSSVSMEGAIGSDIHPRYICSIEIIYRPDKQDYYLSVHITDIKTAGSEGTTFYPLNRNQTPIRVLDSEQMYDASLYIIKDLHESVAIMSETKFQNLKRDIEELEEVIRKTSKKKIETNLKAAGTSLVIPGLGLILKGHKTGYAYLGTEAALCIGGVMVPELMRKSYINKRNAETNAHNRDVYTTRANTCRKISIISGACAGIIHIVNIVHSYVAEPKETGKLQWSLASVPTGSAGNYAMGIAFTYRF